MRKVHINSAKNGDILAKPIWASSGTILLGIGVTLNDRFIDRMKAFGIDHVFIEDEFTTDIVPDDIVRDETRKKAAESVYSTMMELTAGTNIKKKVTSSNIGQVFQQTYGEILRDLTSNKDMLVSLTSLHEKDGYLFHHSVNVAILSGIMGISLGYNRNQLMELGVGSLLFDIGMTCFPDDLLQSNIEFTAEKRERIKKHTEEGFDLLRKQFDISLLSAHCALQHHERYDGSGYPRGLKGNEIHEYAQIVAIADVYDALTSSRSYRNAYSPSEAIEFLYANGDQWFRFDLIKTFCSHIAIYPIASTVLLNTGQVGVVASINPMASNRPLIRIIQERDGLPVKVPFEIDLSKEFTVTITKTL